MWWARTAARKRVAIVLVTDPGPDPDDVKAVLVLGVLHKLRRVSLLAVIANGGGQARARAALAQCVLNHLGVLDVPVGIGSDGEPSIPQAHEFDLAGVTEAEARLVSGHELLLRTLRAAPPKTVRMVLISSLRDFADVIDADAAAVLASVHTVAIQGGLEADPTRKSGWRADSSVNNGFDMAAAEKVYAFCFASGLPVTVTSRHAVPLLPMQLARSFAERTDCPVMEYLAAAQSLGLEGLWWKLCDGLLPPRCSKAWYFQTFCGVDEATFIENGFESLGSEADISSYLNGYIKPYDICALMTVLPFCQPAFDGRGLRVAVSELADDKPSQPHLGFCALVQAATQPSSEPCPPNHHLLLLTPEDELAQAHVLNLLRDTYHEVVLATREQAQSRCSLSRHSLGIFASAAGSCSPNLDSGASRSSARAADRTSFASSSYMAESPQLEKTLRGDFGSVRHHVTTHEPPRVTNTPLEKNALRWQLRLSAAVFPTAVAEALPAIEDASIAEGAAPHAAADTVPDRVNALPLDTPKIAQLLEKALESARVRKRAMQHAATAAALSLVLVAFTLGALDQALTLGRARSGTSREELYDTDDAYALRINCSRLAGAGVSAVAIARAACAAVNGCGIMVLSLAHGRADRVRAWLVSFIVSSVLITFGAWQFLPQLIKVLSTTHFQRYTQRSGLSTDDLRALSPESSHAVWTAYYALRTLGTIGIWVFGMLFIVHVRHSTRAVARALNCLHGCTMLLKGLTDLYLIALGLYSSLQRAVWFWPAEAGLAFFSMLFGLFMLLPAGRARAQVLFARLGSRNLHSRPETAIAALLGCNSGIDEREPLELVATALFVFKPVELSVTSLREMGAVLFAPTDELYKARARWRVSSRRNQASQRGSKGRAKETSVSIDPGRMIADVYVVHSIEDDASRKLEALCEWVERFEAEHGRPPRVWLNTLCVDPSLSRVEQLEHLPAYLASSERLLLIAGSRGVTHLWSAVELYVFRALGGLVDMIDVAVVEATPVMPRRNPLIRVDGSPRLRTAGSVVSALDTFHVMLLSADEEIEVRSRLFHAVELVSVSYFNLILRDILPRARLASTK